jgi:hypothetical protein
MIRYVVGIGLLVLTLPFWLPSWLGGDTSFHFVTTESMKGTLDPGSFVVVRRSAVYQVGDVVSYHLKAGGAGDITFLHRIVGRLGDGRYLVKGDAVATVEEVEAGLITGRMVAAVPAIGFVPATFQRAPLIFGGLLLAIALLAVGVGKKQGPQHKGQKGGLFLVAALVLLLAFPFASEGAVGVLGKVPLFLMLLALIMASRVVEVRWTGPPAPSHGSALVEANYIAVVALAMTAVPLREVAASARSVLTL